MVVGVRKPRVGHRKILLLFGLSFLLEAGCPLLTHRTVGTETCAQLA